MNRAGKFLIFLAGSLVLAGNLLAIVPDNYQTIIDRNVFGLNPPPPPPTNTVDVPPPVNVKLSGFVKMNGQTRAFFVLNPQPRGTNEHTEYISLSEGQREGIIEVVKIAEEEGEVKIINSGQQSTLSLKKDNMNPGPKLGPGVTPVANMPPPALPGGVPGQPPQQPSVVATYNPKVVAGAPPATVTPGAMPQPGQPGQPGQPMAGQPLGTGTPVNYNGNPPQMPTPPSTEGLRTIPTRTLRLPPSTGTANP